MRALIGTALALCIGGCASSGTPTTEPPPQPEEAVTTYELSDVACRVEVYTRGVQTRVIRGVARHLLHVGFDVRADQVPVVVRPEAVTFLTSQGAVERSLGLGQSEVGPVRISRSGRLETHAYLPTHLLPSDIEGLRVRWSVKADGGERVVQRATPFVRVATTGPQRFSPRIDPLYYEDMPALTTTRPYLP